MTEFNLSGLKVIVKLKSDVELKGRISFFTRSNCRDCTAVRRFFCEKGLKFIEINIDVYPQREKELIERTGSSSVPQIFFNEKLFGGLVALNSLRNSGGFDKRIKEMLGSKCPDDAPAPTVYGFDDTEEEQTDEMIGIVRVLRQRLPIQDRLMKMKIVKNCFSGSEMVEVLIQHLDCGRRKVCTHVHDLFAFLFFITCISIHHIQWSGVTYILKIILINLALIFIYLEVQTVQVADQLESKVLLKCRKTIRTLNFFWGDQEKDVFCTGDINDDEHAGGAARWAPPRLLKRKISGSRRCY